MSPFSAPFSLFWLEDNSAPAGGGIFNSQGTVKVGTTMFTWNSPDNIDSPWIDQGRGCRQGRCDPGRPKRQPAIIF
jgi:hypothetical protein